MVDTVLNRSMDTHRLQIRKLHSPELSGGFWRPTGNWLWGKRQHASSLVCNVHNYVRSASEAHVRRTIDAGRPGTFIRNPFPTKMEWNASQDMQYYAPEYGPMLHVGWIGQRGLSSLR
jgi:hypothetical protein